MNDFFGTGEMGLNHVQVMVRGMYAVAESDKVHATELVMLRDFYDACRQDVDGLAEFDEVVSQPLDLEEVVDILNTPALRHAFLRSCLFLAFADGTFSDAEREVIEGFAAKLEVKPEDLAELKSQVTDHLIQQVARVQNMDALKNVAKELG